MNKGELTDLFKFLQYRSILYLFGIGTYTFGAILVFSLRAQRVAEIPLNRVTHPARLVSALRKYEHPFLNTDKNTHAKGISLLLANNFLILHCRHKTLHLLEPPPSAEQVDPPRWCGATLSL